MPSDLQVVVCGQVVAKLSYADAEYVLNYEVNHREKSDLFVSLTMPVRVKSYVSYLLHPIFEMHLPEGYLLSIIKKHFTKLVDTDDFGLLHLLSPNIRGRLEYVSSNMPNIKPLHLEDLLTPRHPNLFEELVSKFALNTPLSGVQPKVLAKVVNKATLKVEDYIVKAWGDEYPELALNEFLCMQAVKHAGITVPEFYLSSDDKLFIMKRFDLRDDDLVLGFEDMCVLQAKQREDKYTGSYEQVAKTLNLFASPALRFQSLEQFFKIIVMNTLLQNGDAHLKNFGVLYEDIHSIQLAPAYDIVSTTVYIKSDIPALTLFGSRRWHVKERLIQFGMNACFLNKKQASALYQECLTGMKMLNDLVTQRLMLEEGGKKKRVLSHLKQLAEQARLIE